MRTLWLTLVAAASLFQFEAARAQEVFSGEREVIVEKFSIAGKKTALGNFVSVRPDCTVAEWQDISVKTQPEHGKATLRNNKATLAYKKDDRRVNCNGKTVASKLLEYVPSSGYKGEDEIIVEGINGDGGLLRVTYRITVK